MKTFERPVASMSLGAGWPGALAFGALLALAYCALIAARSGQALYGDELRYLEYARNLSEGFYARGHDGALRNGPGVPLFLLPWVLLGFDGPALRFLNVPLLVGALFYTHGTIRAYAGKRAAVFATMVLALHPALLLYGSRMLSEALSTFLVAGFAFFFVRWQRGESDRVAPVAAALHLGFLALTKVSYAYAIVVGLLIFGALRLRPGLYRRFVPRGAIETLLVIALLCCVPYLTYTWQQTSKFFYWGTNGGETLYWMTVEGDDLSGSWLKRDVVVKHPDLASEHLPFLDELRELPAVERDARFRERAMQNLRDDPRIYLENWVANVGRLLFNVPYSRRTQSLGALVLLIPNLILVALLLGSLVPAWVNRRELEGPLLTLAGFGLIVFAGNSVPSNTGRQFVPLLPILLLWIATLGARGVEFRILRMRPRKQSPH